MKNFRLALRALMHFKLYSVVNVLGLALSLACVIVIARYVHNEITVDHFNTRLDRLYVSKIEFKTDASKIMLGGIKDYHRDKGFVDLRPDLAIEQSTNFMILRDQRLQQGEELYTSRLLVADTIFLQIIDYPIVAGSGDISAPDNLLITEAFARKIFGNSDPLGRQLTYGVTGKPLTVTGIVGSVGTKSSLAFDAIIPYSHTRNWIDVDQTLVLLHPNQDYRALNARYPDYFVTKTYAGGEMRFQLMPLKDSYLDRTITDPGPFRHGNRTSVIVLSLVGLLIGLVGVFNFINIYTAVVLRRGREFGMKKVFGASGAKVFGQLLTENMLMIALALVIALALTEVFSPAVRNLMGFEQVPFRQFDILLTLGLLVCLPLATAVFPFLHYNYAAPVKSLQSVGKTGGRGAARQVFLIFQYVLTIGMIAVSLFFLKQLRFMLDADLGYTTNDIIKVDVLNLGTWDRKQLEEGEKTIKSFLQRVDASPLFMESTAGWYMVGTEYNITLNFRRSEGNGELKPLTLVLAGNNWQELFGLELLQGRLFNNEQDNSGSPHLIVTESVLSYLGITDIATDRIQCEQLLSSNGDNSALEIVGVVKDFHPGHIGVQAPPIAILYGTYLYNGGILNPPVMAKIAPGRKQEAIEFMRNLHQEMVGGEFTYSFIEDDVKAIYDEDRKVATIYSLFTAIAIAISVLGLFSLSLFDVQLRRKEIAIRKVNGATTGDVLRILLKRYIYLLGIAFVIATPIAWYAIHRYLEDFAYRTSVSWWIFAIALLITTGVSLLTLIWQTRKAASTNPAWVVRSE